MGNITISNFVKKIQSKESIKHTGLLWLKLRLQKIEKFFTPGQNDLIF